MNRYKIDWNKYSTDIHPYALFSKQGRYFSRWEHICSCKTKEEATALYEKLVGLPIYLPQS